MNSYADKIKNQREFKGLTQEEVAKKLKMTRQTYNAIETGKRDLTINELHELCNILGLTVQQFLFSSSEPHSYESKMDKFKQLILNCLQYGVTTEGASMNKLKLAALVALCDFDAYIKLKKSISELSYRHTNQGPIVDAYYRMIDELYDEGVIAIELRGRAIMIASNEPSAPATLLPEDEVEVVQTVCARWQDVPTQDVVKFAKQHTPWRRFTHGEIIPYKAILADSGDSASQGTGEVSA